MVQTATESFCERCGTRYTFEAPRPVKRGLGRSLARAVLGPSDEEAFAEAHAHDPFLGTFRFCLECRQYTCPQCWNEEAGFCATCVPFPDAPPIDVVPVSEEEVLAVEERPVLGAETWPTTDLAPDGELAPSPFLDQEDIREVERVAALLKALDDESDVAEMRQLRATEPVAEVVVEAEPAPTNGAAPKTDPSVPPIPIGMALEEPDLALEMAWNHLLLSTPTQTPSETEPGDGWFAALDGTPAADDVMAPAESLDAEAPSELTAAPQTLADTAEIEVEVTQPVASLEQPVDVEATAEVEPGADVEATAEVEPAPARPKSRSLLSRVRTIRPAAELVLEDDTVVEATSADATPAPVVEMVAEPEVEAVVEVTAEPEVHADAEPAFVEAVAEPVAEPELVAEPVPGNVEVETVAEPVEVEAVAEPVVERTVEVEPEVVAAPTLVAEPEVEVVSAPEIQPVAEPTEVEAVAEPVEVEAVVEPVVERTVEVEPEVVAAPTLVAEPAVEVVSAPEIQPFAEPVEVEAVVEPVVEIVAEPAPTPPQEPAPPAAPPKSGVTPPLPGWQLTAPDDAAARPEAAPTVWPPIGPVYKPPADRPRGLDAPAGPLAPPPAFQVPRPPTYPPAAAATPSMLVRAQGPSGGTSSGIRPCGSCELPLSASARFCRRCGSRQG